MIRYNPRACSTTNDPNHIGSLSPIGEQTITRGALVATFPHGPHTTPHSTTIHTRPIHDSSPALAMRTEPACALLKQHHEQMPMPCKVQGSEASAPPNHLRAFNWVLQIPKTAQDGRYPAPHSR
jgi:hypothetical protein